MVSFSYSLGTEKDYSKIAKADNLAPLELEVYKMADQADVLRNEYNYMKTREATHRNTSGTALIISIFLINFSLKNL